jgi:hypothetical protein
MTRRGWWTGAAIALVALCGAACAVGFVTRDSWGCYVPLVECLDSDVGFIVIRNERLTPLRVTVTTATGAYTFTVLAEGEESVRHPDACRFIRIVVTDRAVLDELVGDGDCRERTWIFRADGGVELLDYYQEGPAPTT